MDDGKEITVPEQKGVEQERIEDIKRRILKAALKRVTTDPAVQTLEYPSGFEHPEGEIPPEPKYTGDINMSVLSLSEDSEDGSIVFLSQTPVRGGGDWLRRTLGYGLNRAINGYANSGREVAITTRRKVELDGKDGTEITRVHFADIKDESPDGKTINYGVKYTGSNDSRIGGFEGKHAKFGTLEKRWKDGELQAGPTDHIDPGVRAERRGATEEDYERILRLITNGKTDVKSTAKVVSAEVRWREAKSISAEQPPKGNRIIDAVRKRVPLLRLK